MKVTICGAGNAAQTLIALLAADNCTQVTVYAPLEDEASRLRQTAQTGGVSAIFPDGSRLCGRATAITADAAAAAAGAELVLLALPAFAHEAVLAALAPHLPPHAWIGALPARGGFDLLCREVLPALPIGSGRVIFGLQTLPWACRVRTWGAAVDVLGAKAAVDMAVWPPEGAAAAAARLSGLLRAPLAPLTSFLALTLANTGQIIHPGIMYGLFHRWDGTPFRGAAIPLFYGGVDAATAALLAAMSSEVLAVRDAVALVAPSADFARVADLQSWLLAAYPDQIADGRTLQAAFASNRAYAGLTAPMTPVGEDAFVPAFGSRYLAEDVPYSLLVTRGIAELAGVATPTIDRVIEWAQERLQRTYLVAGQVAGRDVAASHAPQRFGVDSLAELIGDYEL